MLNVKQAMQGLKNALAARNKTAHEKNFEKRWELVGFQKPSKKIKQHDGTIREFSLGHSYVNREGKRIEIQVPIYQSKHWSSNKYNVKEINKKQVEKSLAKVGKSKFSDSTEINKDKLVDLW